MAQDCYKVFKTTYAQGIADGLATAVATAAAQTAQQDCLAKQSRQVTAVQSIVVVPSDDTTPGRDRASGLGQREK